MKIRSFFKIYILPLFIPVTLLALTLFAFLRASSAYDLNTKKLFHSRVNRVAEIIKSRMNDYSQILKGCQGLFYASDKVTKENFRVYIDKLDLEKNFPEIQGLAASVYLPVKDTAGLEKEMRSIIPGYKIKSNFNNPYIAPVTFIEPLTDRNLRAVGFDLYSEDYRRQAIIRAIKTGQPSITKKIKLVQETGKNVQPGFLMFLAIYEEDDAGTPRKVKGFVTNVFRTHNLMRPLLNHFTELNLRLFDGEQALKENLIYEKVLPTNQQAEEQHKDLKADTLLNIGGVSWRLSVTPNVEFGSNIEEQQPYLILLSGVVLSLLLFLITARTIKRRIILAEELARTKALEQKKDEFMTIASHELKTPLTNIKSTIQLLERLSLSDKERTLLHRASKNIEKLQKLISDLLDVSKIQSGKLQLDISSFTLDDLVSESIENVKHIYPTYKIIKKNPVQPLSLQGDKYRLEQVINNLLLNAIKYSPATDRVFVNTLVSENSVRIEIIDEGMGIDKPDQKRIFERFFRSETLSPVISGLGMGLYIANEIVKRHQGIIGVESEPGKGSTFYIILPLKLDEEYTDESEWKL